jgi:actin-related protein
MTIFLLIKIVQNIKCKCCTKSENSASEAEEMGEVRGELEEKERQKTSTSTLLQRMKKTQRDIVEEERGGDGETKR